MFPNGRVAASAGEDGTIHLWDLEKKTRLKTFEPQINPIHTLAISADGKTFVIGGKPTLKTLGLERIYLLDTATGELKRSLQQHKTTIESIALSADGGTVAAGARYEDVQISATTGQLRFSLPGGRRNEWIALSP